MMSYIITLNNIYEYNGGAIMKSKDMIEFIKNVEKHQHGITQLYPSRIKYFQRTNKYDAHTFSVDYDDAFEKMIKDFEASIGGTLYRPTAKKILNNWFAWALEQRTALLKLQLRNILSV